MPINLPKLISYFHDCYQADNRELTLFDFLDSKVENRVYMEGKEELLTGAYPIVPIDSTKAVLIQKKLEIYEKEKELIYASFFICGHAADMKGEIKRVCAPLFYYSAQIEEKEGLHYLSIDPEKRRVNFPLFRLLGKETGEGEWQDELLEKFPQGFIGFEDIGSINQVFQKYFSSINRDELYAYPQNVGIKYIRQVIKKLKKAEPATFQLLPGSMLGIVSKSFNTRGVLNELQEIAQSNDFSFPLQYLFGEKSEIRNKVTYQKGRLPIILSEAQQALLKSAAINPLTLIVGPPGTGKTYTIGAIAIEHMSRGESVLIASRTDEAVDVIAEKIRGQLGFDRCVVRGGNKRIYTTSLKRFLKALLTRVHSLRYLLKEFNLPKVLVGSLGLEELIQKLNSKIDKDFWEMEALEKMFHEEVGNELKWGEYLSQENQGLWHRLKTKYIDLNNKMQTPLWEIYDNISKNDGEQVKDILEIIRLQYVAQLLGVVKNNWKDLKGFYEAIQQDSDTERLSKFEQIDMKALLKAFPIWLVNLSSIKDVMPLQKELYDVLIIDEATQCDIASCLPLMQRAKRVVFAGDPNQLRHVSFLSRSVQSFFQKKFQLEKVEKDTLNYREKSILDLAMNALQAGDQLAMLDEHFRSVGPIIAFSNERFYDNSLRIMTKRPDAIEKGLYLNQLKGIREQKGHNVMEASQLLKNVRIKIDQEADLAKEYCTSIGVLSPFRAQVDYIGGQLYDNFSMKEIEKHQLRVGTAYSFQGEERDIMHLSFAVDAETHPSAFHHVNKEDVFNVSITRARQEQHIYLSVKEEELKRNSLLRDYLEAVQEEVCHLPQSPIIHDRFLEEVIDILEKWKMGKYWKAYPIAGLTIDLLLKYKEHYLGIDLVGYPGEFEGAFGIERFRILQRAGIRVFPLPYSDWYFERDKTTKALKAFIFKEEKGLN
ncbi:AAA domain-containing protein [Xanthovirga aplysinae]|uniref:AAA domain-containing protein n=1 Tax=Xanthovirga aplysinae TaxID=2529853 RepID=UPI0012BB5E5D|nr:DEAD/DEAH box helicase [Xanthovirga aplysinae]MTI31399.1 hypothetical protein [Xanthovirga aplysinae]